MRYEQARKLGLKRLGVYRIWWKDGGNSVASIGQLHDGTLWFAPSNWTSARPEGIAVSLATKGWEAVRKLTYLAN